MPTAIRAVLFDLDDTLFDHSGSVRTALAQWLPDRPTADLDVLTDVWFELERVHYDNWRAGDISFDEQRRRRIRDFWPHLGRRVDLGDDLDALFATYLTHYEHSWQAFDDAGPVLAKLGRLGYVTAVLTNGATVQQNAKIDRIGLRDQLSAVITSEELGVAKPDPGSYLRACQQLGVQPQQTLHVGDRYDLDVLSARDAGLRALHLDRNSTGTGTGTGNADPERRLRSLFDLPARLETAAIAKSS